MESHTFIGLPFRIRSCRATESDRDDVRFAFEAKGIPANRYKTLHDEPGSEGIVIAINRDEGDLAGFRFEFLKASRTLALIVCCKFWTVRIIDESKTSLPMSYGWDFAVDVGELSSCSINIARNESVRRFSSLADTLYAHREWIHFLPPFRFNWHINLLGWFLICAASLVVSYLAVWS